MDIGVGVIRGVGFAVDRRGVIDGVTERDGLGVLEINGFGVACPPNPNHEKAARVIAGKENAFNIIPLILTN